MLCGQCNRKTKLENRVKVSHLQSGSSIGGAYLRRRDEALDVCSHGCTIVKRKCSSVKLLMGACISHVSSLCKGKVPSVADPAIHAEKDNGVSGVRDVETQRQFEEEQLRKLRQEAKVLEKKRLKKLAYHSPADNNCV